MRSMYTDERELQMTNEIGSRPRAILNLQRYYQNCLGYSQKSYRRPLLVDILNDIVESEIKESDLFFSIVYEKEGNLFYMTERSSKFMMQEKNGEAEREVQLFFDEEDRKKQRCDSQSYFRHIGVWLDDDNEIKGKIYYVFRIYGFDEIQAIYLNSLEEAYYEWTKKEILKVANSFSYYEGIREERRNIIESIIRRAEIIFEEKMVNFYGIDLAIVTEISGNYYEGGKCNSTLKFKMGNNNDDEGIFFAEKDYVEIKKENARNLRKILEMCQEGQCIIAEREEDLQWMVKGLCYDISNKDDVLFNFLDHTFWELKIGNRLSVCYKYGKYIIRQYKRAEEFEQIYKRVFGRDIDEYLKIVFEEGMRQPHGTSIIVLDDGTNGDVAKLEVERLLKESTGIAIEPYKKIPEKFIIGVTSIDGAMILDKFGKCYAIAAILDGNVAIKGDRAHGARHNSVMKYIKAKQDSGLRGIGMIFSEDRTIRIVSTEDDFGGCEYEYK